MTEHMTAEQLRELIANVALYARTQRGQVADTEAAQFALNAIANSLDQLAARLSGMAAVPAPMTHRHRKRGTECELIGEGRAQTADVIRDMDAVMLYREADGALWVRPSGEFNDGRFERVTAAPEPPHV